MRTIFSKRIFWGLAIVVLALLSVVLLTGSGPAAAQTATDEGIVCTDGPNFDLTTQTGYIGTPDDNVVYMWGYAAGNSAFQHPSPVLCVNEGETVTVILRNTLPEDVSITFPGQDNVLADGAPAQPQFDGTTLTSLTNVAFIYQSGTDPAKQVRMGLFGALIVRPIEGPNFANNRPDSVFNPDTEFMVLLSEIDPYLNQAVEREVVNGQPYIFNMANYHPRYWLINGRGFPDSFAPNFASWLPNQPYGALARVEPHDENEFLPDEVTPNPYYNPDWSLTRYLSVGTVDLPMHPHSKSALVIGRDGRAYEGPGGEDLSFESFSLPMGPGQTWDGLFRWFDPDGYDPNLNPVTVDIPSAVDVGYGPLYSASPYLGQQGTFPVDFTTLNECGEYYVISHVHALHKITSWGAPMTGPITFLRIDPPGGCQP
jgi:FtsP/CotA-like multicopper oxidase with cupredoxin domain